MNKSIMLGIAVGVLLFIVGTIILGFVKDDIGITRTNENLNCNNGDQISDGTKLTCLVIDFIIPYFFITLVSVVGGSFIGNKAK